MNLRDRRTPSSGIAVLRLMGLTDRQMQVLLACQRYGWRLGFIREPLKNPQPVLFATAHDYVVVRADGSIDRSPDIEIRH